jgi:hypothetical protein
MTRFRKWLIRKLGGYVFLANAEKIVYKSVPVETVKVDIALPNIELGLNEDAAIEIVTRKAAHDIGEFIVDNHLYSMERIFKGEFDREFVRFTIKVSRGVD